MTDHPAPSDLRAALEASGRREEELRAQLASTRGMLDSISEAIYIQDAQGRFLEVNEGAARMYGYPQDFFIGQRPEILSAPGRNDPAELARAFGAALAGTPQVLGFWGLRGNGEVFPKELRLYPGVRQGEQVVVAVAQDISVRRQAELTQQATFRVAEAAIQARNAQELFAMVHGIVRDLMPAENFYVALWNHENDTLSFPYWVDQVDPRPDPKPLGRGLTEYLLHLGQPVLLDEAALLRLEAEGKVLPFGALSLDWLGVPLHRSSGVFGALVVQSYEGAHRYTDMERDLLSFVSGQVALALERTEAQREQRILNAAIDKAMDPVYGMNAAGRLVFVNQAAETALGYSRQELLGLSLWDIEPGASPDLLPGLWAQLRERGASRAQTTHRRKDGSTFPVETSSGFITTEGREMVFTQAQDITERKAAEAALWHSEERFSRVFHASPDAINLTRLDDGTYIEVSEGFERLTGWSRAETLGRTSLEMNIWVDPADRQRAMRLIRERGEFVDQEISFRRKDGSTLVGLMSAKLMEVGGVPGLLTITRDISDRKAAEAALRIAERRLRTVLANSQAIIYQLDPEGRFLLSEGLGLAHLGLIPGAVVGLNAMDLYRDDPETVEQIRRALEGTASRLTTRAAGRLFDNSLTPVFDEQGVLESVIGIATDVTERQQIEAALRAERGLFVGGPVMVIRWKATPPWPVDYVSPNVQALLGYSPEDLISGRIVFDALVHPEDQHRIHSEAERLRSLGGTHYEQQYRLRNAAGEYRWFHDFTAVSTTDADAPYFLGYMLDITDRRQAEEVLRQSQKLESLGILAGGIAHDFNNLLTVVLGNLNLAQLHLPEGSQAQPYLERMEATVLRATELTKQMLAYSGRGHFLVQPQDLNDVVQEVTHLLEVSISKKIRLLFELEPGLPAIHADAAQVQQVVMNLVTNASDAIGDQDGTIHLTTSSAHLGPRELEGYYQSAAPASGRYVLLEVADTGCGMTSEILAKIFDPFYTTKTTGRGLGLSAMLGILKGHGAGLQIQSSPGRGSHFRICFPASQETAADPAASPEHQTLKPLRGRILLVDDESLILETMGSALRTLGLEVTTACDGLEALARFQAGPRFDAVLMDLTMPRLGGREAFLAMHELDPALPVVLSSGFTEADSVQTLSGTGPAAFIQKPYQLQELHRVLQRVLAC